MHLNPHVIAHTRSPIVDTLIRDLENGKKITRTAKFYATIRGMALWLIWNHKYICANAPSTGLRYRTYVEETTFWHVACYIGYIYCVKGYVTYFNALMC